MQQAITTEIMTSNEITKVTRNITYIGNTRADIYERVQYTLIRLPLSVIHQISCWT